MKTALAVMLVVTALAGLAVLWSLDRWAVSVSQVSVLVTLIVFTIYSISTRGSLPITPAMILPVGLLCCGIIQLLVGWTVYRWPTQEALLYWLTNLGAVAVAAGLSQCERTRSFLRTGLFWGGTTLALISVVQGYTSDGYAFWVFPTPYREDVWGPFVYHNQYAAFIELLLPVAIVSALEPTANRWAHTLIAAALYACVVASASRMGLVMATVELVVVGAVLVARRGTSLRRFALSFGTLFVLICGFGLVVGPEKVWQRMQEPDPYGARRDMTTASIPMVRDKPITGFGLGTWPTLYPKYATVDDGLFANQAHNDWVQMAVEAGIPGLVCLIAFFAWALWMGVKNPWSFGICFVLIHAFLDYPLQRQALAVFFFAFSGTTKNMRIMRSSGNYGTSIYSPSFGIKKVPFVS